MKTTKILVGICSHLGGKERRESIRETWLKIPYPKDLIEYKFFIGGSIVPTDEIDDIIALPADDRYEYLPEKCMEFYKWANNNYDFEYLFKCDDDTFLAIDRLIGIIDENFDLIGDKSTIEPGRMAPSGGAGYLLSKKLVKDVIEKEIPSIGYEDLIFGELIRGLGYQGKGDDRLCLHSGKMPLSTNDMVSCHWCSIEQMYIFYQLYNNKPLAKLKAVHEHWKDDLYLYEGNILRRQISGDIGKCENHGCGIISINWLSWEKELLRKKSENTYENSKLKITNTSKISFDILVKPINSLFKKNPKVAICLASYKRFEHLERQIFSMLNQSYKNKHVFVAVKGVSEYFYNTTILPLFKSYISQGKLTLRYFPNKNQLSNLVDTIRDLNISEYDLFLKIDDDDFYSPDYVMDCCRFHKLLPKTWSSCYSGVSYQVKEKLNYPIIQKASNGGIFGFSLVLSKKAMESVIECEQDPMLIHPISRKWDHCEGHHGYGFTEDHLIHNIMKEIGYESRNEFILQNKIDFHITVNKVIPSMTRGSGVLQEDFKSVNGEITTRPEYWEHILEVKHPYWHTNLRIFNKKGMRVDNGDSFEVLYFDGKTLLIKWDKYGVEKFVRDKKAIFVKRKI